MMSVTLSSSGVRCVDSRKIQAKGLLASGRAGRRRWLPVLVLV